jgi:hypothetical protein
MLHGLAGIDRKAAKTAGNARNKMQHGKSGTGLAKSDKISIFQRVYW